MSENNEEATVEMTGGAPNDLYAAWQASQEKSTDAVETPEPAPEEAQQPAPEVDNDGQAPTDSVSADVDQPSPERKAAEKLAGIKREQKSDDSAALSEDYTRALKRTGMRDTEVEEVASLIREKPWMRGWLDGLAKSQSKQDSDFAALKARVAEGAREPTPQTDESPDAQDHLAPDQGDQPGSVQFADLIEQTAEKFGEELGADNAKLLRDVFGALQGHNAALERRISELDGRFEGYANSLEQEKAAAEFENHVQRARHSLREDFPWIDDDAAFDRVVDEMTAIPTGAAPDEVRASMEKAARIAFFDEVKADVRAASSRLDNSRKTRLAETAPGSSLSSPDRVLSMQEIQNEVVGMIGRGEDGDRIKAWQQRQFERLRASEASK